MVLLIIGVLAALALPSYSRYVRTSARADAQSQMLKLAGDLERWRSKNLSYAGFIPDGGFAATGGSITSALNATIYIPAGSDSTNYKYQLALLDGTNRSNPLAVGALTAGQRWVLIAQPNTTNSSLNLASRLVLSSQGVRCMTNTAVTDASMRANIVGTSSDSALCVGISLAW